MAIKTWSGGGDGTSWDDPDNWSTGFLPSSVDTAIIDNGSSVQVGADVTTQCTLIQISNNSSLNYQGAELDDGNGGTYVAPSYNSSPIQLSSGGSVGFYQYSEHFNGASIIVGSGTTCAFLDAALSNGIITVNSGGTLNSFGGQFSGQVTVNAGGTFLIYTGNAQNVRIYGSLQITGGQLLGVGTIYNGGVCSVQTGSILALLEVQSGGSLTIQNNGGISYNTTTLLSGATCLVTGTGYVAAAATVVVNAGASLRFTNGGRNQGTLTGTGVPTFDKSSFLSTLKGSSSTIHNPATLRYPSNLGAGAL